ncbi:DNA polymerase [Pleurocapsa sp. CCALA 161]|uniref:DNA polymerase n=1 Tax=Pleurocapsa sp. CCALA 161 TaxID=2107688 RepID=UPI00210154C2|nr:DNA polymerase [Pleurocapsa sp. CCALA 161]
MQADCADILKRAISSWDMESVAQGLDAHLVLTAYDQLVIETRKDCCDRVAQVLERVMIEAGRDILAPIPVVVDVKMGKYWS